MAVEIEREELSRVHSLIDHNFEGHGKREEAKGYGPHDQRV